MTATECSPIPVALELDHGPGSEFETSHLYNISENAPLDVVVTRILGKHVELQRLQKSGAEGQSGCLIYFARKDGRTLAVIKVFPPTCRSGLIDELLSYKKLISLRDAPPAACPLGVGCTRDELSGALSGVVVYQVAPGKAINTMLREVGQISTLRRFAEAAFIDKSCRTELESFVAIHRNEILIDWNLHDSMKDQGDDRYFEALPAFVELALRQTIDNTRTAVKGVAAALAKLHKAEVGPWTSDSEATLEYIRHRLNTWVEEIRGTGRTQYETAGISSDKLERLNEMVNHVIQNSRHQGVTSLIHGDASTGNFFWDPIEGVTMIDYGSLNCHVDQQGRPTGPAELDAAGFYERLRKYAAGFGVNDGDISLIQDDFWDAYLSHEVPLNDGIVRLIRTRIQMSRLWSAVAKFNKAYENDIASDTTLRNAVDFEWKRLQMISGLYEPSPRRKVLVVANLSGPGKGGLPMLNQELVKAMSELDNVTITLLMVSPPTASQIDLSNAHGQAEVFTIPYQPDCAPSELLYYAAKIHQPDDFGLPATEQKDTPEPHFDLIIGHCRYSSAAAKLVRDRWYPAAKLAIITHTSPLRKSDAAWIWYGETREQGYVEAARLAMLDEKVLPKADLAIGVGPVLTSEAREREYVGQLNQPRASEYGPRFHEMIPGVHVEDRKKQKQRQPDDPFRVLLAGRADDPAKGVNDAIYAVMRLASTGAQITLDVLGVHAEHVEDKQREVDEMTQVEGLVRIHAFSDDPFLVRCFYRTADLVIMPSTHEGFGMIFTEAAGQGIPALATQESGAGQFALDRKRIPAELGDASVVMDECAYGITPSPSSKRVAIWADKIEQIRTNPTKAFRNARALQEIMRSYSWKCAAEALLRSALESPEDDTIQMANGIVSRSQHLAPEVMESMNRSIKTRNASGVPDPALADEVLRSLPEIEPTSEALEKFASATLNQEVVLKPLCESHPKGFSGAPIFFAYSTGQATTALTSPRKLPSSQGGKVLAVVKLFTHGLDNGITDELSSLEWLIHQTRGEINVPIPITVCRMTWEGKKAGVVIYTVAAGKSLAQLMTSIGQLKAGVARDELLEVLKKGSEGAARTLAKLHNYGTEGRSSERYLDWYYAAAPERACRVLRHEQVFRQAGIDVGGLSSRVNELIRLSQQEIRSRPRTAVVHGDAHPANFFYDAATSCITMIDVTTLHCSLDESGIPVGTPERDIGHFIHMLRRTGEPLGMRQDEMDECSAVFLKTYLEESKLQLNTHTLRLLVVCSALSFLGHAAQNCSSNNEVTNLRQQTKIVEDMFRIG